MEEKEVFEITKNIVANFIDDEDKFVKQQTIDHIIQNGKYYDTGNKLEYLKTVVEFALKNPEIKSDFREYLKSLKI